MLLLNIKDIKKNFKKVCCLDFEIGKFIYTEKISKEQLEKNKTFDFIIDVKKESQIKIDITNFNTDLQQFNNDSSCINSIMIYDGNEKNPVQILKGNHLEDINNSNILEKLEKGKKYLIRVELQKPCSINIIREDGINKVKFLGESNKDNFKFCKPGSKIIYKKEEEDKNNFIFEKDIKDTVKIARQMEKFYEEPCISQFKKISKDEIIIHGNSTLNQKLLFKVVNDVKSSIKGIDATKGKEIIEVINDKIKSFKLNEYNKNKELSLTEEKIGIIDEENNDHYI